MEAPTLPKTRLCRRCGPTVGAKPIEHFSPNRQGRPGRRYVCQACSRTRREELRGVRRCEGCPSQLLKPFSEFGFITVTKRLTVVGRDGVRHLELRTFRQRDMLCLICRTAADEEARLTAERKAAIVAERKAADAALVAAREARQKRAAERKRETIIAQRPPRILLHPPRPVKIPEPSARGRRSAPPAGQAPVPPTKRPARLDYTAMAQELLVPTYRGDAGRLPLGLRRRLWALAKVLANHFAPPGRPKPFPPVTHAPADERALRTEAEATLAVYLASHTAHAPPAKTG